MCRMTLSFLPEIIPQNEQAQLGTDKSSIRFFDTMSYKHLRPSELALRYLAVSIPLQVYYRTNNINLDLTRYFLNQLHVYLFILYHEMCARSQSLDTIYGSLASKNSLKINHHYVTTILAQIISHIKIK